MKLPPGPVRIDATGPEGSTTVLATATENGLRMGVETYVWDEARDLYVGEHVDATLRAFPPGADGKGPIQGSTGVPPNQRLYGGTWRVGS